MAVNPPAWTVTGQQETVGQTAGGAFVEGVRVTFRTADGSVGSVFVPRSEYLADNVQKLIQAQAATMAEIAGMQG